MKYIIAFFLFVALIWSGWKYIYTPYQIKKSVEKQLASQEVAAKKQLESQVAEADFLVIIPKSPPKGYYLVKNSFLSGARDAADKYYKTKTFAFDYQNANGTLLTVNEKLLKAGEKAKPFSEDETRWDSAYEIKLANGTTAYLARKSVKNSIAIPQGGTLVVYFKTATMRFNAGETLINIDTSNAPSFGNGNLPSDKELIQFANYF